MAAKCQHSANNVKPETLHSSTDNAEHLYLVPTAISQESSSKKVDPPIDSDLLRNLSAKRQPQMQHVHRQQSGETEDMPKTQDMSSIDSNISRQHSRNITWNSEKILHDNSSVSSISDHNVAKSDGVDQSKSTSEYSFHHTHDTGGNLTYVRSQKNNNEVLRIFKLRQSSTSDRDVLPNHQLSSIYNLNYLAQYGTTSTTPPRIHSDYHDYRLVKMQNNSGPSDNVTQFWCNICITFLVETRLCKYIKSHLQCKYINSEIVYNSSRHSVFTTSPVLNKKSSHESIKSVPTNTNMLHVFDAMNKTVSSQRSLLSEQVFYPSVSFQNGLGKKKTLKRAKTRKVREIVRRSKEETVAKERQEVKNETRVNMTQYRDLLEYLQQYRSKDPLWAMLSCMGVVIILLWAVWACGMRRIDRSHEVQLDIHNNLSFVTIKDVLRLHRPFLPKHIFRFRRSEWRYTRLREADLTDPSPRDNDDINSDNSEDERVLYSAVGDV